MYDDDGDDDITIATTVAANKCTQRVCICIYRELVKSSRTRVGLATGVLLLPKVAGACCYTSSQVSATLWTEAREEVSRARARVYVGTCIWLTAGGGIYCWMMCVVR